MPEESLRHNMDGEHLGATLGARIQDTVYVWDERVDATALTLKKTRDLATNIVNGTALILSLAFLLFVCVDVFFFSDASKWFTASFWFTPSLHGLSLALSLFFGCFIFYRLSEASRRRAVMPKKMDGPEPAIVPLTSLSGPRVNIAPLYATEAIQTVERAYELASGYGHKEIEPLHLFVASLPSNNLAILFGRLGLRFETMKDAITRRLQSRQRSKPTLLSPKTEETLLAAFINAYQHGRTSVSTLELFSETFSRDEFLQELFLAEGVDSAKLANVVAWIRIAGMLHDRYEQFRRAAGHKPTGPMNRAMTSVATPSLDAVSEDLTTAAVYGRLPLIVGREKEIEEMFRVMEGGRQSVILVGADGVGKSAVLAAIAQLMVEERVPNMLQDKRLVALSIPHLISGASPAEAQERLMRVFVDVARARNIILVLPNLEQLTGITPGGQMSSDLADALVDFLSRGATFAIATATPEAYLTAIERSSLGRAFEKVAINEPDTTSAIHMLESKIGWIEYEMNVMFSYEAVEKAVLLSDRYMHEAYLPEKAIEVCREAALMVSKSKGKSREAGDALVTGEDIAKIVADKTNIPLTSVAQTEKDTLLHLEERMHGRVIGQEEAVKAVSAALRRARTELRAQNRPISNFLFLGPTGVGKTELAKTVAEVYFGSEEAMLRFDMSEYQDPSSLARLLGVPGSKEGGLMTEAVRQHPFSIILLDELEKAHPDILNVFLQVFDDGRLTDAAGRTIDFTNTIIIATSNAGAPYIQDAVAAGASVEQMKTHLLEQDLRGVYRPEFLNRFDGIIVFRPLTLDDVTQIAYLLVAKLATQLEPKGIHFRATDEAVSELTKKGFDPKFGARPLRRVVQEQVDNAIANALLEGKVARRDTIILNAGGGIEIEKAVPL